MSEGRVTFEHVGDDVAVLSLFGEHDLATAPHLPDVLAEEAATRRIVVDVTETEFIDSSTINALSTHHHRHELVLQFGTAAVVRKALYLTRLLEIVPACESREEAVRLARG
jgi:anti-anti-sigma factor